MNQTLITPPGVEINNSGKSLRIFFMLNGVRCRETINLPPTRTNIKYASNLRAEILNQIAKGSFNYANYFPESKLAKRLGFIKEVQIVMCSYLFEQQLIDYAKMADDKYISPATFETYKRIIKGYLIPELGKHPVNNLTSPIIRKWITNFTGVTNKTITNIIIPLKQMLEDALNDELITVNPINYIALNRLIKKVGKKSEFEVNPFTEIEKRLIINAACGQTKNFIQFGFWSGLRTSELIALKWDDIDFNHKIASIHTAKVYNVEKCTKTKSGTRTIVLLPQALEALTNQLNYTKTSKYVFHNPNTNLPWANSSKVSNIWRKLLLTLDIPYRNCYQMRHTYASTLLSNGENIFWVAKQMGHANINTLIKHYGRWIPNHNYQYGYDFNGKY